MHQSLPHDLELESVILGAILLDKDAMTKVATTLSEDTFYDDRNKAVFKAMAELSHRSEPIDMITTIKCLKSLKIEFPNFQLYVSNLTARVASSANLEVWSLNLKELWIRRVLIKQAAEVTSKAFDLGVDVFDIYGEVLTTLNATYGGANKRDAVHVSVITPQATESIVSRSLSNKSISGYSTSIQAIDRMIGGHQKSDLMYMAGRPGMGKTAMALTEVLELGKQGVPVAFFSLEMSSVQVVYRLMSMMTGIPSERLMKYKLDDDTMRLYYHYLDQVNRLPIYIDDSADLSVFDLSNKVKNLIAKHKVEVVFVDYIQLMSVGKNGNRNANREQELSTISRNLKLIAKECNIPMVVLAQLSRAVESRSDKKPMISDLRESGSLEQDADIVTFLFRPEYYGMQVDGGLQGYAEYIVSKQRNGGTGAVPITFNAEIMKYTDLKNSF